MKSVDVRFAGRVCRARRLWPVSPEHQRLGPDLGSRARHPPDRRPRTPVGRIRAAQDRTLALQPASLCVLRHVGGRHGPAGGRSNTRQSVGPALDAVGTRRSLLGQCAHHGVPAGVCSGRCAICTGSTTSPNPPTRKSPGRSARPTVRAGTGTCSRIGPASTCRSPTSAGRARRWTADLFRAVLRLDHFLLVPQGPAIVAREQGAAIESLADWETALERAFVSAREQGFVGIKSGRRLRPAARLRGGRSRRGRSDLLPGEDARGGARAG